MRILATVILPPLVLLSRPVSGQVTGARADTTAQPDGLKSWLPSKLVPGAFYMPLVGEGAKSGPYVFRFKAPPGTRIPAHWHTQTMHQTVLSGTLLTVMGESLDSSRVQRVGAGGFLVTPAYMRHIEWFESETVIHVETQVPIETQFVNPNDDPRRPTRP
jgi:quercetin dioxygenase-like cupin family protein